MPRLSPPGTGRLLALAVLLALTLGPVEVADSPLPTSTAQARTVESEAPESPAGPRGGGDHDAAERTVPGDQVCPDAGYLCADVQSYGSYRVIRFPATTGELRIHVPAPRHEEGGRAAMLRDAAIRGIGAWNGRPFPIRFVGAEEAESVDIVLRWEPRLPEGGLGETQSRFSDEGGVARYRVADLALATRHPYYDDAPLDADDVELTATHEMGHALGLPHSDSRGDLMYPTDAADQLSERDFLTLQALYRIPNGARIVK